jgi:D-3-phosphoglycerate dehydrogenase / 2-oxoglutarate reductase
VTGAILITCRQMQAELPVHIERLANLGLDVIAPDLGGRQQFSAAELLSFSDEIVGIIAGDDELSREFFEGAAPHLRSVIRWGIGMDSVDFDAAADMGVPVRNTPGVFGGEVADAAIAYLLAIARGTSFVDREVRGGKWPKYEGVSLDGATVGVIGLGAIGRQIVRRVNGFGSRVLGYDPFPPDDQSGFTLGSLEEITEASRFVILCCPLTPETHHLVDRNFLQRMRKDAYIVNVARGPVIDEEALVDALTCGTIAGAALDVFEIEPLPAHSPLRAMQNVVLGAHNGSNTREGVARASAVAVNYLIEELTA